MSTSVESLFKARAENIVTIQCHLGSVHFSGESVHISTKPYHTGHERPFLAIQLDNM